ncbi:DUF933 domain-containing protein [uncultured Intestinimonas sp.]|uniref:DUF933 domain-containing protein n=1 Tax=uncultured Intestinimonas sp. TaxID=1689265 RepID=UPI003447FE18
MRRTRPGHIGRALPQAELISAEEVKERVPMDTGVHGKKGLVRSEGKEYVVQDGDVILFRFNV